MEPKLSDHLAIRQVEEDVFESLIPPHRMGNSLPIAYGGNTMAVGVNSAAHTVKPEFKAYSITGYFLAPGQIDRPIRCKVTRIRDTRSFATRRIVVSQDLGKGKSRDCLEMTVDFQVEEEPVMKYSAAPTLQYSSVEKSLLYEENFEQLRKKGEVAEKDLKRYQTIFGAGMKFLDYRQCPEGVSGQNMGGFAKHYKTTLDHLSIPEKASGEHMRVKEPMTGSVQTAALAYILDGGLSFLPLVHDHKMLEDVGACSTLEFAVRIFTPHYKLDDWHFRERKTIAANAGRTYTESRFWNDRGEMIACMSQQSIMRPLPPPKPKAPKAPKASL